MQLVLDCDCCGPDLVDTSDLDPLKKLLPTRLTKPGIQPTMKSKWVNSKEVLADDDWVYPPYTPTLQETRLIQGHVAEIGVTWTP